MQLKLIHLQKALSLHCHRETGDRENMKVSKKDISTNIRIPFTVMFKTFLNLLISLLIL